jgi:single-strand DNA-binding protein
VATFRVASTPRVRDTASGERRDGDSLFLTCNVWRLAAENMAESLQRGTRVIVSGRLRQRQYETKEGEKRTVYEIEVRPCGTLRPRSPGRSAAMARVPGQRPSGGREPDPWASEKGGYSDEPPYGSPAR